MTTALLLKIGADVSSLRGELNKASGLMDGFRSQMGAISGAIAGAFTVGAVVDFTMEAAKLAGQMEGVKAAFDKLPQSAALLRDLERATKGTVNQLDLMKAAVKANNFKIPLETLGNLLQFANLKAQETGQSVDYMVDSLITGIGRQSLPILDNLQISATQLRDEFARVGDFGKAVGNIVSDSLKTMDASLVTSATKSAQLTTNIQNLKLAWGELINEMGAPKATGVMTEFLSRWVQIFRGENNPANDLRNLQLAIGTFNKSQPTGKDFLDQYAKLENLAKRAGQQLLMLKDEATGVRQLFIKPAPVTFVKDVVTDVPKAIGALTQLKKYVLDSGPLTIGKVDTTALTSVGTNMAALVKPVTTATAALGTFEEQWAALGRSGIDATAVINQGLAEMAIGVGVAIGDMMSGVGGMQNIGAVLLQGIANMMMELGKLAIGAGIAIKGIKKALTSLNPAVAIAGGIALIALSRAISNKAGSIANGGGGGSGGGGGASSPAGALTKIQYGNRVEVTGEFELRNDRLVAAIRNENRRTERTLPTSRG